MRRRIAPLKAFARRLKPYLPGILALPLAVGEGINNKIKVIKRMAYGLRDNAYFFVQMRAAFPEFGDEPKKGQARSPALR